MGIESAPKRDLINLSSPPLSLSLSPPPPSPPPSLSLSLSVFLLLHPSPSLNSCSPLQTGITQWRVHQRMVTDSVPRRYFTNLSPPPPPSPLSLCLCLQPQSIVDRNHPVGNSEDRDRLSPQKILHKPQFPFSLSVSLSTATVYSGQEPPSGEFRGRGPTQSPEDPPAAGYGARGKLHRP